MHTSYCLISRPLQIALNNEDVINRGMGVFRSRVLIVKDELSIAGTKVTIKTKYQRINTNLNPR